MGAGDAAPEPKRRLFVSDLDGTLLRTDASLSDYARDALNRMIDAGLLFTVASARSAFSMRTILDGLRLPLPVIEHNGAYVTRLWEQEVLVSRPMCRLSGAELIEAGLHHGVTPVVSTRAADGQRIYLPTAGLNGGQRWFWQDRKRAGDHRVRPHADPVALPDETLMGMTFIADQSALHPLSALVTGDALPSQVMSYFYENNYSPGWHWLTVHAEEATKAHGLRYLCEHLGLPLSQATVFGDEINDLPMFALAGRSVAVDNAVPQVKRASTERIGAHGEDSVVRYLERVMEG